MANTNGIKLTNRKEAIRNLQSRSENIEKAIIMRYRLVGLQFVRDARIQADFTDRTGNLRSSIGFILTKDGRVIEEDFNGNPGGQTKGLNYAKSLTGGKGIALIVVAGMEYAAAVESKGFDVITGSSKIAEGRLNDAFKSITPDK